MFVSVTYPLLSVWVLFNEAMSSLSELLNSSLKKLTISCFIRLIIDNSVWDHSTFTANRSWLLEHDVITERFEEVVNLARKKQLLLVVLLSQKVELTTVTNGRVIIPKMTQ
jgi:hypothetical protein